MLEESALWPFSHPEPPAADPGDVACFARVFSSPDGRRVLARLQAMTLDRALGPEASDAALRHLEGQRALVAFILAQVCRGGVTP